MSDGQDDLPADTVLPIVPSAEAAPSPKRGFAIWAWLVIAVFTALTCYEASRPRSKVAPEKQSDGAPRPPGVVFSLQGRYLIGFWESIKVPQQRQAIEEGIDALPVDEPLEHLARIAMRGETAGPQGALEELDQFEARHPTSAEAVSESAHTLRLLYRDYAAEDWAGNSVDQAQRERLVERLGWFGRLALVPAAGPDTAERAQLMAEAQRLVIGLGALLAGVVFLLLAGLGLLAWAAAMWQQGRLHSALGRLSPWGDVYAETFALWLALFEFLGVGLRLVIDSPGLGAQVMLIPATLLVLAWPVLRGVSWRQLRSDIGWTLPVGGWRDLLAGVMGYVAGVPLVAAGLLVTLLLLRLQVWMGGDPGYVPSHPLPDFLSGAGPAEFLLGVLAAVVVAPLVEETMFRGVLYRHLRESSRWLGLAVSIVFSALVNGLVFAAVHPQGLTAVPSLAALAVTFSLLREWRGSLAAPMIAHAMQNGLVMAILWSVR